MTGKPKVEILIDPKPKKFKKIKKWFFYFDKKANYLHNIGSLE